MSTTTSPVAPPRPPEPSTARLILTLTMAGLLSGLGIAGVYQLTLPRITANKAAALREAVFKVVPGSSQMQPMAPGAGGLAAVSDPEPGAEVVYGTWNDAGEFTGYAITGEGSGFQDVIKLIYGYDPARGRVVGMEILQSRETPGLGDKIFKDADFVACFSDLAVAPAVELVKNGEKTADNHVDAITGATISSRAVVKIIQATNESWLPRLLEAGSEPPPPAAVDPAAATDGR